MASKLSDRAKGLLFAAAAALIWCFFILLSRFSARADFNGFDLGNQQHVGVRVGQSGAP